MREEGKRKMKREVFEIYALNIGHAFIIYGAHDKIWKAINLVHMQQKKTFMGEAKQHLFPLTLLVGPLRIYSKM